MELVVAGFTGAGAASNASCQRVGHCARHCRSSSAGTKHRSLLGWKLQHGGDAGRLCSRRQRMGDTDEFKPDAGLDDLELLNGDVNP